MTANRFGVGEEGRKARDITSSPSNLHSLKTLRVKRCTQLGNAITRAEKMFFMI